MIEQKIDRHDLVKLMELAKEIAQMHVTYIKKGFKTGEIAETFASIYFHQFAEALDEEGLKCLQRELPTVEQIYGSKSQFEATGRMCINMASGFLKAVAKAMGQNHDRT